MIGHKLTVVGDGVVADVHIEIREYGMQILPALLCGKLSRNSVIREIS
jgi:hypothetical protein